MRINVTKSFLPPLAEYNEYLKIIWENNWLTNQGPLLKEFEHKTKKHLGVEYFHFVTNGTLALQVALRALDITEGEIITTPFSYVATTSAILWERCTPVYVDIEPDTFCIDANKIEGAITPKTKAIMAVHVFGFPCDIEKIETIAKKHNLKVIYDAAHAFGVEYKGKSLLGYGDISTGSFHATKSFHTVEGGCVVTPFQAVSDKLDLIKRFGHDNDEHFMLGINAKASEFQAAMGLLNLEYIEAVIGGRKTASDTYNKKLSPKIQRPAPRKNLKLNYAYYPVLLKSERQLIKVVEGLSENDIFPRRYFYPSLNELSYLKDAQPCPISEDISRRILCLPLYHDLATDSIAEICNTLNKIVDGDKES